MKNFRRLVKISTSELFASLPPQAVRPPVTGGSTACGRDRAIDDLQICLAPNNHEQIMYIFLKHHKTYALIESH